MLMRSPIYLKYKETAWTSITQATIEADLAAIKSVSFETLPLINFLEILHRSKVRTQIEDVIDGLETELAQTEIRACDYNPSNRHFTQTQQNLSDYDLHVVDITLAAGAAGTATLYAPGAGYQYYVLGVAYIGSGLAAGAAQNYVLSFNEESGSAFFYTNWLNTRPLTNLLFALDGSTDDKDFQMSVAGGDGVEHLYAGTLAGKFT